MYVIPVRFSQCGKELLGRFQHVVSKRRFSVSDKKHSQLITQMRTAIYQDKRNSNNRIKFYIY
jgi:hypothetical protein